jgi:hypothetical protein
MPFALGRNYLFRPDLFVSQITQSWRGLSLVLPGADPSQGLGGRWPMSQMGDWRRFDRAPATSGLPRCTDILGVGWHVPKVPWTDTIRLPRRRSPAALAAHCFDEQKRTRCWQMRCDYHTEFLLNAAGNADLVVILNTLDQRVKVVRKLL